MITAEKLNDLGNRLGADPRELIPCRYGTKRSMVRGFNQVGYSTGWERLLRNGPLKANVAMLFGSHSQFIALDCDSKTAVERVSDLIPMGPRVITARGVVLLAKSGEAIAGITSSGVLKLTLEGADVGELRLQRAYSLIGGLHPTGISYELVAPMQAPSVNLPDLVSDLRGRGFEMPELLPPAAIKQITPILTERSSDAGFWCQCAAELAEFAPARSDRTAGTNGFVLVMTTGLRTRPQLSEVVVSVFTQSIVQRGLQVRGGQDRLLTELNRELTRWRSSYGHRVCHRDLKCYVRIPLQRPHQTEAILVHFLAKMELRSDYLAVVCQVGDAFLRRAQETGNPWSYETVRALEDMITPKTMSRVYRTLVASGLVLRAENTLPSTLPPQLTATWMYRCSDEAIDLLGKQAAHT